MTKALYARLASTIDARLNCVKSGNKEWQANHEEAIAQMAKDYLPHGSGIDTGCDVDILKSTGNKIVIDAPYHFMDGSGYYDGWEYYTVVITPSLAFGYDIRIIGKNRSNIKEYLHSEFSDALSRGL